MVGIAMYVSQERFDLQFATKSLASFLKNPKKQAWVDFGRVVGHMRFSKSFAMRMGKASKGSCFQGTMCGSETETQTISLKRFQAETGQNRSRSAAVHVLNGIVIWSTSGAQNCISLSLSSTEAEWYANPSVRIQIGQAKTSKSNQMAKQSFRALSIFSVMSLAEGNHFPNLLQMIHEGSPNALSWWCSTWSPINMISTALLFILAVPPVGIQQTHEGSG